MFGQVGYDTDKTYDCKWELDSLASFSQISSEYYNATGDIGPFEKYTWVDIVEVILYAAEAMRTATYTADGHIAESGYTMVGKTDRATETTSNNVLGNPITWTGMVRSTFRPSDDATIFQFLIPSNMMFARYLEAGAHIMENLDTLRSKQLTERMRNMASEIRAGTTKYGVISHPLLGAMYAFEVDGYGSQNIMDKANLPSLLSAPMMGYVSPRNEVYQNTRMFALGELNPYWAFGDVFSAIGGLHMGPMKGWPLAAIVRILTSEDASGEEIRHNLKAILGSTDGLGLVHESIKSWNGKDWSRQW
jgi:meiotically up-regulated gene 157 (Mug157) protein